MRNKGGIELSANFLVILIISIAIFAGGIVLVTKFFSSAADWKADIDSDTELRINQLLADGSRVAVPFQTKHVGKGDSGGFWVGINNVLQNQPRRDFEITLEFDSAFNENDVEITGTQMEYMASHWYGSDPLIMNLAANSFESTGIAFRADNFICCGSGELTQQSNPTVEGTYVFNLYVKTDIDGDGVKELYDGHVHKLYIEVS